MKPTPQQSIRDVLKQHWFNYIDAEHKVKGNNSDRLANADEIATQSLTQLLLREKLELIDTIMFAPQYKIPPQTFKELVKLKSQLKKEPTTFLDDFTIEPGGTPKKKEQ